MSFTSANDEFDRDARVLKDDLQELERRIHIPDNVIVATQIRLLALVVNVSDRLAYLESRRGNA